MTGKNRIIGYFFTFLGTILFLLSFTLSGNAQTLYSCSGPNTGGEVLLLQTIDPNTGALISSIEATLPGVDVSGCNGFAKDPTTDTCYMILSTPTTGGIGTPGARLLATLIDPLTGQLRLVGNTGQRFAAIAFDNDGTLYGLTGDQNSSGNPLNPSTLFTINKGTAASTIFLPLVVGDQGNSLGFNPNDGLLYRAYLDQNFESIDPDTKLVTTIPLSGDDIGIPSALTHQSGNVLLLTSRGSATYFQ